jgi:hypothetical protein
MGCRSLGTVRWCNEATVTPLLSRTVGGTRIVVRAEEELRGGNQRRLPEAIREIGGSKKEMTAHLHERKQGRTLALTIGRPLRYPSKAAVPRQLYPSSPSPRNKTPLLLSPVAVPQKRCQCCLCILTWLLSPACPNPRDVDQ